MHVKVEQTTFATRKTLWFSRVVIVYFHKGFPVGGRTKRPDDANATRTDAQITEEGRNMLLSYQSINSAKSR